MNQSVSSSTKQIESNMMNTELNQVLGKQAGPDSAPSFPRTAVHMNGEEISHGYHLSSCAMRWPTAMNTTITISEPIQRSSTNVVSGPSAATIDDISRYLDGDDRYLSSFHSETEGVHCTQSAFTYVHRDPSRLNEQDVSENITQMLSIVKSEMDGAGRIREDARPAPLQSKPVLLTECGKDRNIAESQTSDLLAGDASTTPSADVFNINQGIYTTMGLNELTSLITNIIHQTSSANPSSSTTPELQANETVTASSILNCGAHRAHNERGRSSGLFVAELSKKDDGRRIYDKQLACFFCEKLFKNKMKRHLMAVHQKEPEVAIIVGLPSKSEQDLEFARLTNRGNFNHNVRTLDAGVGMIIVARRSPARCSINDYLPCVHCLELFVSGELGRHSEACKFKKPEHVNLNSDVNSKVARKRVVGLSRMLLAGSRQADSTSRQKFREEVLDSMRIDDVSRTVRADPMILKYGEALHRKLGRERFHDISQRMRQLARLLLEIRREHPDETTSLDKCLTGQQFDAVMEAAERLCGLSDNESGQPVFGLPSLGLKLGHSLAKCAEIKRGAAYRNDDAQMLHDADAFVALHKVEWTSRIASASLATLKQRKYNNPELMPVTSDLLKLKTYQEQSISKLTSELIANAEYRTWRSLAEVVYSRVVIFNKRRSGETAKLLLSSFTDRPNWAQTANDQLVDSLCPVERELLRR